MKSGKEYNCKDVRVFFGGVELTGVSDLMYISNKSILELKKELKIAEENEQYEFCLQLQKEIKIKENELSLELLKKVKEY